MPILDLSPAPDKLMFGAVEATKLYAGASLVFTAPGGGPSYPTGSWLVANFSYDGAAAELDTIGTVDNNPQDLYIRDDGIRMWFVGSGNSSIYQYTLSTAWELSTATYDSVSLVISADPESVWFRPDGMGFFTVDSTTDELYYYALSTAWDISTGSSTPTASYALPGANPKGVWGKPDGTRLYVTDIARDLIDEIDLSTPFDLTTASLGGSHDPSGVESSTMKIVIRDDGLVMFTGGSSGDDPVYQYSLSTAWDITTASYDSVSLSTSGSGNTDTRGLFVKPDGTRLYIAGSSDDIYQYSI